MKLKLDLFDRTTLQFSANIDYLNVCFVLPLQPVNATHALKRSAGVSKYNVSLGRSFN
jgi:hypothetical protein